MSTYILSRKAIRADGLGQVGRKALGLWQLCAAGFDVPEFFVVATAAWESVCSSVLTHHHADLNVGASASDDRLHQISRALTTRIEQLELPQALVVECRASMRSLRLSRVAVRSSAIAEDETTRSFAGIYDSFLDVDEAAVPKSIVRCWASAFSVRSLKYRRDLSDAIQFKMAVVIQAMVECDIAAVVFTVDPVNQRHILVEAAAATTPAVIVDGSRTPARFLFSRHLDLVEQSGDVNACPISVGRTLAELGLMIERRLGSPQDIECGLKGGHPVVFQSRPISTLNASAR